eukprot:CAMPEP_0195539286 /NCGR_PEP_ID=MMETSP0794_2-20130614/49976_1 /TAXON_ID=515487 /ORGANISM="Stephanopyxis turris, Strain CCMP 815" /LENGTH=1050 /DNA_ID=CAMNT_0040673311 /DNA_START=205 /DNA_END=3357 /DNA_ORIENTATION=-
MGRQRAPSLVPVCHQKPVWVANLESKCTVKQRTIINQVLVTLGFLLIIALTIAIVTVSIFTRNNTIQLSLSRRADARSAAMNDALFTWARLADQVGRTMAVAPNTTTESYRFITSSSNPELEIPALVSVSWAVPVENTPNAIADYEAYARRVTDCPSATINYHLGGNYSWRPSPEDQPEFLPFTQTTYGGSATAACGASFVGFDLLAIHEDNEVRRTSVLEAIAGGEALASAPVDTAGTPVAHLGVLQSMLAPVFVDDGFVGLVSAAFQATDLVAAGAVDGNTSGVFATLTDTATGLVMSSDLPEGTERAWTEIRSLTFGGRTWELLVIGDRTFAEDVPNETIGAAILAVVLTIVVFVLAMLRVHDEAIVAKATKRLLLQMSHDLRTPLHSIWHSAQQIAELPSMQDNAAAVEPIETLKWCAALSKNILDNILDMSHITKGTLDVNNAPQDILHCLSAAVQIMHATARDRGTKLTFAGDQTGRICLVDREKLLRVVLNIMGNAIKFTPNGAVRVEVSLDPAMPEEEKVMRSKMRRPPPPGAASFVLRVKVIDDGMGMDAATLATATRPYQHASRDDGGGSGIGLHVAKTIVEQYGGTLELDSEGPDKGSSVVFSMLVADASDSRAPQGPQFGDEIVLPMDAAASPHSSRTAIRVAAQPVVLVVDDSRMNRRVAIRALTPLKHVRIEECQDGVEALERLKALTEEPLGGQRILCLMDQTMPNMNGDVATRKYRSWAKLQGCDRQKQAWICLLTGDVMSSHDNWRVKGFDHMLTKPCPADPLRRILTAQIRLRCTTPMPVRFKDSVIELGGYYNSSTDSGTNKGKEMAPSGTDTIIELGSIESTAKDSSDIPSMINSGGAAPRTENSAEPSSDDSPSWINSSGAEASTEKSTAPSSDTTPAWINNFGAESRTDSSTKPSSDTTPAWINSFGAKSRTEKSADPSSDSTPSWINSGGAVSSSENSTEPSSDSIPAWINSGGAVSSSETSTEPSSDSIPAWINNGGGAVSSTENAEDQGGDSIPAWINNGDAVSPAENSAEPGGDSTPSWINNSS